MLHLHHSLNTSRYYAFIGTLIMAFVGGYAVFLPGNWSIPSFLFSYTMIGIYPILFIGWKVTHRTTVSSFFLVAKLLIDLCPSGVI